MTTFKQIVKCIQDGGSVVELSTQLEVVAYLDSINCKCLYLGEDKQVYLEISADGLDDRELEFVLCEKED